MPKSIKGNFRVSRGNSSVQVYRWTNPGTGKRAWRFAYQEAGKWRYITRANRDAIVAAAERVLGQQSEGFLWEALSPARKRFLEEVHRLARGSDETPVLGFLQARQKSNDLESSVARFMEFKEIEAGELTPYLRSVESVLEGLVTAFPGRSVSDIQTPELAAWWTKRSEGISDKRKRDIRTALVTFWNWAKREGIAGNDATTAAERLPTIRLQDGNKAIIEPVKFMELAQHVDPQDRAAVVLGYFCGLRPEEAAPPAAASARKKTKRGLYAEEIDWDFKVIRLPKVVSKVGQTRIVPLSEAALAWLEWAGVREGRTGPICPRNLSEADETKRLGKLVFGGTWPKDALRHSYGSYRNAQIRSLDKVAEEMGTSVAMLHASYHNPRATGEGEEWAALRPPVPISSDANQADDEALGGKERKASC